MEAYEADPHVRAARTWDGQQLAGREVGDPDAFFHRLTVAAQDGILIGVKWMVVIIMALWSVSWALGDYSIVRQRSLNGQQAFEFIQQQVAQQKAAQKGTP